MWRAELDGSTIHLAVEGGCGGTTIGIQLARQAIQDGGRVLWAAPDLPDGIRFSQIFADLNLSASSRFHGLNLGGNLDMALESLSNASNMLPGVSLIVLDDYCPDNGRMTKNVIEAVNKFTSNTSTTVLLISKGGEAMDGSPLIARGRSSINHDQVWLLVRANANSIRTLFQGQNEVSLKLEERGFILA